MTTYWWYRPSRIALLFALPIAVFAYAASDRFYQDFGAYNTISAERFLLAWLAILGFAGASWIGEILDMPVPRRPRYVLSRSNYAILLYGTVLVATLATCILLFPFAQHPQIVLEILRDQEGAAYFARAVSDKITGITSQENLFNFALVLLMLKREITGRPRGKGDVALICFILGITAVKVVIYSERLALVEMIIPLVLLGGGQRRRNLLWAVAPVAGVVGLYFFFLVTEYYRSWAYYAHSGASIYDFALNRVIGYYMTAINNGAFIYSEGHSYYFPVFTANWLWHLPIPGLADFWQHLTGANTDLADLLSGLNIEYNNTSGVFAPLVDFGPLLGVLVWACIGFGSGRLYRRFREGEWIGLVLFPTWFVGVVEIPRVFYWGDGRYFPPLVASLLFCWLMRYALSSAAPGMVRTRHSAPSWQGAPE